jgi:hypothetical protein
MTGNKKWCGLLLLLLLACGKNNQLEDPADPKVMTSGNIPAVSGDPGDKPKDAGDYKKYEGIYHFKSLQIEIENGATVKRILPDYESCFVEITLHEGNVFFVDTPIYGIREAVFPVQHDIPFVEIQSDRGGGETKALYFYRDGEILLRFYSIQMHPLTDLGWDGEVSTEEVKCEMVFSK